MKHKMVIAAALGLAILAGCGGRSMIKQRRRRLLRRW